MNYYYLNKNKQPSYAGGNYELHKSTCPYYYNYKDGNSFYYIGCFSNDKYALDASKNQFPLKANAIDGCANCCPDIHNN